MYSKYHVWLLMRGIPPSPHYGTVQIFTWASVDETMSHNFQITFQGIAFSSFQNEVYVAEMSYDLLCTYRM